MASASASFDSPPPLLPDTTIVVRETVSQWALARKHIQDPLVKASLVPIQYFTTPDLAGRFHTYQQHNTHINRIFLIIAT